MKAHVTCHDLTVPHPPPLRAASALLLVIAGGLAIGGSFGTLDAEFERVGTQTLTLTYTSWLLIQGGTYSAPIGFHAPHFGIPLVVAGALTIAAGVLLVVSSGGLDHLLRLGAVASAGLLVGTVWTVGIVVAADLDATSRSPGFESTWTIGAGFWLVLAAGVAAVLGATGVLLASRHGDQPHQRPEEPAEPPDPA